MGSMLAAYSLYPSSALPADAKVNLTPQELSESALKSLHELQETSQSWLQSLQRDYLTAGARLQQIRDFSPLISQMRSHLAAYAMIPAFERQASDQATQGFLSRSGTGHDKYREREYLVYDAFFRIYRREQTNVSECLDQFLKLYQLALLDIQYTDMPADEFCAWIGLLEPILALSQKSLLTDAARQPALCHQTLAEADATLLELSTYWEAHPIVTDESEKRELAFYRWFCGHQLWNCVLNFTCAQLETCLDPAADTQDLVQGLRACSQLIRGFTSVLWYTMNFPSYLYQKYISPAMEEHSRRHGSVGLSGTQGQDFRHYKAGINALYETLTSRFGRQRQDWPDALYGEFEQLQNYELLFHEHHIILSQQKIQLNYESILQRLARQNQKSGPRISAMEAMRDLRDAKRKRLKSFFD